MAPKLSSWLLDRPESWPDVMAPIWLLPRFVSFAGAEGAEAVRRQAADLGRGETRDGVGREGPDGRGGEGTDLGDAEVGDDPGEVGRAQAVELGSRRGPLSWPEERLESLAPKLSSWLLDRPESWPRRDGADLAAAEVREFAGAEGAEAGRREAADLGSRRDP